MRFSHVSRVKKDLLLATWKQIDRSLVACREIRKEGDLHIASIDSKQVRNFERSKIVVRLWEYILNVCSLSSHNLNYEIENAARISLHIVHRLYFELTSMLDRQEWPAFQWSIRYLLLLPLYCKHLDQHLKHPNRKQTQSKHKNT